MEKIKNFTVKFWPDSVKATKGTGLFPETLLTQAALETGYANSRHSKKDVNNFFGIKANKSWTGPVISSTTREFLEGQAVTFKGTGKIYPDRLQALRDGVEPQTLFRVYPSIVEGFKGWVNFLQKNPRYEKAGVFSAQTPEQQFAALKRGGYATDPNYVVKLLKILEGLKKFTTQVFDKGGPALLLIPGILFLYLIFKK